MTTRHIYVDETKERGYVMVASTHLGPEVDAVRKELRSLVLRGQNRIHMAKESDSRRKAIIDTVIAAGVTATVYDAGRRYGDDHASRAACLRAIVDDMGTGQPTLLVLEQDDTLVRWDRQQLVELLHASGHRDTARYQASTREIRTAADDPRCDCLVLGARRRMAAACELSDHHQAHLTPDSAKPDRAPSGTLSGSLPEAQRNRHHPIYGESAYYAKGSV